MDTQRDGRKPGIAPAQRTHLSQPRLVDRRRAFATSVNYAFNRGDWYVWGGSASAPQPNSPSPANVPVPIAAVTDGPSNTLFAAEVKTHTPYLLNCSGLRYAPLGSQPIPGPNDDPSAIAQYVGCSGGLA
jgi:hypothetical protein